LGDFRLDEQTRERPLHFVLPILLGCSYNLFNRVQFGQPGNLTSDPGTFGQSTSEVRRADQTSGARQIQFGLRLRF